MGEFLRRWLRYAKGGGEGRRGEKVLRPLTMGGGGGE